MYNQIFVAGTFDGLHAGHQRLLAEAFREGEKVTIGLTTDAFVQRYKLKTIFQNSKLTRRIHSYQQRLRTLEVWLREQRYSNRTSIISVDDPHEPAASMPDLDALIVTRENRTTGARINALRQGASLSPLTLIDVPIKPAEDGKPISSTRLRNGEIDQAGNLVMPESLREALGKPLGRILRGEEIRDAMIRSKMKSGSRRKGRNDKVTIVITVGDLSTKTVLDTGVVPTLAVIDGQVGRKPFPEMVHRFQPQKASPFKARFVKSGPGFISREAIEAIQAVIATQARPEDTRHALIVDGEEDLLVLPVIQYAPLGSILYYGQPGEGLVEVEVTSAIKKQAVAIMKQFLS